MTVIAMSPTHSELNLALLLVSLISSCYLVAYARANAIQADTNSKAHQPIWPPNHEQIDAPKFYRLNALLYKQTAASSGNGRGGELKPREGSAVERPPLVGSGAAGENDDDQASAMDALIGAMRRRSKPIGAEAEPAFRGTSRASNSAGSMGSSIDDEATVQRKSTNFDEASDALGGPARLRGHHRGK